MVAFAGASLLGALLLWLPIAAEPGQSTTFVTALFTSTSAVCVTGLVVVDTAGHWSTFGEVTIMGLIQVGGFGIIALSSLLVAVLARRLGLRHRLIAAEESGTMDMSDVRRVLLNVAVLTVVAEALGAVLLAVRFATTYGESIHRSVYLGVFHSVSAFNNAGFALFSDSLMGYQRDPFLLTTIAVAIIAGGLGLPVWSQIGRHRLNRRAVVAARQVDHHDRHRADPRRVGALRVVRVDQPRHLGPALVVGLAEQRLLPQRHAAHRRLQQPRHPPPCESRPAC